MPNEKFLHIYNEELRFLKESGKVFAEEHPQVAQYLGMNPDGILDPFVERLLEGTAFLSSRVKERIDYEHPEFALQMLSRLAPLWHTPMPSIATIAVKPDLTSPQWQNKVSILRHSRVHLTDSTLHDKPAIFCTGRELNIQPVNIEFAECVGSVASGVPSAVVEHLHGGQAYIRLRFTTMAVSVLSELCFDPMYLTMAGDAVKSNLLIRYLLNHCTRVVAWAQGSTRPEVAILGTAELRLGGVSDKEALLPQAIGELPGSRLMREYFAAPSRFYTVELHALNAFLEKCTHQHEFELIFALDELPLTLLDRVSSNDFHLFATPVVNLYSRRCDPVLLDKDRTEHQVVVDRLNPAMYEIHHLTRVQGLMKEGAAIQFSSLPEDVGFGQRDSLAGFSTRRKEIIYNKKFKKSAFGHNEVFITLSKGASDVVLDDVKSLSVDALICDRHLFPQHLQAPRFQFEVTLPIDQVELVRAPSLPRCVPDFSLSWDAVQLVAVNPLRYVYSDVGNSASLMRHWLNLFAHASDQSQRKRISSLLETEVRHRFERYQGPGPIAWVRGAEISMNIKNSHHADQGAYLFGKVLHFSLSEYCQLNQTLRCKLLIDGEFIAEWGPLSDEI